MATCIIYTLYGVLMLIKHVSTASLVVQNSTVIIILKLGTSGRVQCFLLFHPFFDRLTECAQIPPCVHSCVCLTKGYKNNLPSERHLGPRAISHQRERRQANCVLFPRFAFSFSETEEQTEAKFSPQDAEDFLKMELSGRRTREADALHPHRLVPYCRLICQHVQVKQDDIYFH